MKRRAALVVAGIAAVLAGFLLWQRNAVRTPAVVVAPPPVLSVPVPTQQQQHPAQLGQQPRPEGPPLLTLWVRTAGVSEVGAALAAAYLQRLGYQIDRVADEFVVARAGDRTGHVDLSASGGEVEIAQLAGDAQPESAGARVVVGLSAAGQGANAPTPFAIRSEDHPQTTRITLTSRSSAATGEEFIAFALSRDGQAAIESAGWQGVAGLVEERQAPPDAPADYARVSRRALRTSFAIRFRPGTNELDERARDDLQRIADLLREPQNTGRQLRLLGFAGGDDAPAVSLALARALADRLEALGVPIGEALGLGDALPLDSNETPAGRWRNRRVEVWINR
jgi:outer membrane protein OmpA-like peptidoglycan-associated protein